MKQHLRQEKNCLNCGAQVDERYCTHCGQQNSETRESFSHLLRHFFDDVTHYDSKFLVTIRDLLIRPGFLTKEYLAGKRQTYLHPIRMYLFISFLYFLVTLSFVHSSKDKIESILIKQTRKETKQQIADSLKARIMVAPISAADTIRVSLLKELLTDLHLDSTTAISNIIIIAGIDYRELRQYDSLQRLLPEAKRDKGLKPWLYSRWLKQINRYGNASIQWIASKTRNTIPKMMFILLPLFALLLKLFYNKQNYFYADHAIFSLHFHSAVFLLFLGFACLGLVFHSLAPFLESLELVLAFIYLIWALRNAYQEAVWKSVLKGIMLTIIYSVFIIIGFLVMSMTALL